MMDRLRKVTFEDPGMKLTIALFRTGRSRYSLRTYTTADGKISQHATKIVGRIKALHAYRVRVIGILPLIDE